MLRSIEGNLGFKAALNKLGGYPFGGVPSNNPLSTYRYIYTTKKGWIDMTHLLGVAYKTNKALEIKISNEFLQSVAKSSASGYFYARNKLWDETVKVENAQTKNALQSSWSYEDAPSNLEGLYWYLTSSFDENLSDQLEAYMQDIGATNPQNAPNWNMMPMNETVGVPPTATNQSFDPMYTSNEHWYTPILDFFKWW